MIKSGDNNYSGLATRGLCLTTNSVIAIVTWCLYTRREACQFRLLSFHHFLNYHHFLPPPPRWCLHTTERLRRQTPSQSQSLSQSSSSTLTVYYLLFGTLLPFGFSFYLFIIHYTLYIIYNILNHLPAVCVYYFNNTISTHM